MINSISSWAKSIILAVIIATIIEMLIPECRNKKYIKTVIGIYIIYTIVSPALNKITNADFNFNVNVLDKYVNETDLTVASSVNVIDANVNTAYSLNIKKDIKDRLREKGYIVNLLELNIEFENTEKYGTINSIKLQVEKDNDNKNMSKIEKIQIDLKNNTSEDNNQLSEQDKANLKNYLYETYNIDKNNIDLGG